MAFTAMRITTFHGMNSAATNPLMCFFPIKWSHQLNTQHIDRDIHPKWNISSRDDGDNMSNNRG